MEQKILRNLKKTGCIFCFFIMGLFFFNAKAQAVEVTEGNFVFDVDYYSYTAVLEKYTGSDLNVVIPSTADGCTVTEIGEYAFNNWKYYDQETNENYYLTNIYLPGTIKVIGKKAFAYCKGLTQMEIPSSVTTIGNEAFSYCTGLEKIEIPSSVTLIGYEAFIGCSRLSEISLPSSITVISEGMLYGCSALTKVTIPNSVTEILRYAFYECSALTSVNIPESVNTIGYAAFSGCESLLEIAIPSSVEVIENSVFSNDIALNTVKISSSVTEIKDNAFYGCTSLTTIIIPSSVVRVDSSSFSECSSLQKVFILGNPYVSNSAFLRSSQLVIYGIKGSRVEEYCQDTGTHFSGFEAPVLSGAVQNGKAVALTWTGVSGANTYDVYRRDSSSDTYGKLTSVNGTSYRDTSVKTGNTYYYMIAVSYTLDGVALNDIMSDSASVYYEYVVKPKKAPVIKLRKDGYRLNVKIKKQNVQYYEVQYSTSKKFPSTATNTLNYSGASKTITISKFYFTVKKKYYIRVRAYNQDSKSNHYYGKWSQVKSFKFKK